MGMYTAVDRVAAASKEPIADRKDRRTEGQKDRRTEGHVIRQTKDWKTGKQHVRKTGGQEDILSGGRTWVGSVATLEPMKWMVPMPVHVNVLLAG